ncbi:Ribosomal lysine N-methyltransferase 5 like protein [Verticillium longisporum]|uniref:Ribosomal lysine N-methyltransferase 5 like protein n=1 Tax=Verticillium longisporum TaxID=100787 RepID=A0A8I2ZB63_VERLO|nr:Ribosomal lysine N-methyltransferase 5 like protein [Verticillium longisporum]
MSVLELLESFEDEVLDPEEETFALFSAPIPSANLGFIDPRAAELDITLPPNRDFTIHQSPTLLASSRAGGTTGAVLWKITPLFAAFLSSPDCPFLPPAPTGPASSSDAAVLELGCGISALTGLACGPRVGRYVLTDQPYVARLVQRNLDANERARAPARRGAKGRAPASSLQAAPAPAGHDVFFEPLDWELDEVTPALTRSDEVRSFDLVVACDCIYNDALVEPLVQTSVDACLLRRRDEGATAREPTLCIVAQQLRSPEVFEAWLKAFHRRFRVWRVPDQVVGEGLAVGSGFVVHVGILRD